MFARCFPSFLPRFFRFHCRWLHFIVLSFAIASCLSFFSRFSAALSSGQLNQCIHLRFVLLAPALFARLPFCALMHFIISSLRHNHTLATAPASAPFHAHTLADRILEGN